MKINLILPLLCFAFSAFAQSDSNLDSLNYAEIEFEELAHSFGTLDFGADCSYNLKFKNTGNIPLIISSAMTTCGCDVGYPPKEPILPGQTGVVRYKYDSNRIGPFTKMMTVLSNAKTSVVIIKMTGTIVDNRQVPTQDNTPKGGSKL